MAFAVEHKLGFRCDGEMGRCNGGLIRYIGRLRDWVYGLRSCVDVNPFSYQVSGT